MGYFRLCDICDSVLNTDLKNFISVESKPGGAKDICDKCLNDRIIVSMPGEKILRGSDVFMTLAKTELDQFATMTPAEISEIIEKS